VRASLLLMVLACAGCSSARSDVAPSALASPILAREPAAPSARLPVAWHGTWTSADGGAFLAIADDRAVVNLPGLPRRAARVTAVVVVAGAAAVTLDDGATLVLAVGRATGERTLGDITLAADRAVLDVGIAAAGASATVRLWGDGQTTWLPVASAAIVGIPLAARAPGSGVSSPDDRLLAAVDAAAEPLLAAAAQDVLAHARRGAGSADLDAVWAEHARQVRLAALERLESLAASPAADGLAEADRLVLALAKCSEAYAAWRAERG